MSALTSDYTYTNTPRKLSTPPEFFGTRDRRVSNPPESPYRMASSLSSSSVPSSPSTSQANLALTSSHSSPSLDSALTPPRKSPSDQSPRKEDQKPQTPPVSEQPVPRRKLSNPPEYMARKSANVTVPESPRKSSAGMEASASPGGPIEPETIPASYRHDYKMFSIGKPSYCHFCKEFIWYYSLSFYNQHLLF